MSTQVQYRRGSNVQVAAFTGALGEIVVDTTNKVLVVNDGSTVGGFPQVGLTATQTITNKVYNGTSVSVSGNVVGGNVTTAGLISATGNITSAGNISGTYLLGNASFVTGLSASKIFNGTTEANIGASGGNANISVGGTSNVAVFASTGEYVTGLISASGNITSAGNVSGAYLLGNASFVTGLSASKIFNGTTEANIGTSGGNANITVGGTSNVAVFTTGGLVVTGAISLSGNIVSTAANATANIGSATTYFNTVHAKATSAQYADVAEKYVSDHAYPPGTVLDFGGDKEVTVAATSHSTGIAGVVSTNPAYLMNAGATGDVVVEVALLGRVPCNVIGTINKGDRLVASYIPGVAQALNSALYQPGCIIGKALENYSSEQVGTIEVVVGRV